MKNHRNIQKDLSKLPKHSLEEEQKRRILRNLMIKETMPKKNTAFKPVFAVISSLALLAVLLTVQLNDQNNITTAPSNEHTKISLASEGNSFQLADTKQKVFGIENKVALLMADDFVAEDKRRVAKLMIFFWGESSNLVGKPYYVEATSENGETLTMSEGTLSSSLNSEDAHTLTKFPPFPTEGKWQLSFFVNGNLHQQFSVNVLPPFPKTEHYTFLASPQEIHSDEEMEFMIESNEKDKQEIEVLIENEKGTNLYQQMFTQDAQFIDAETGEPIYSYTGELVFPKTEVWTLIIDGEKTMSFQN